MDLAGILLCWVNINVEYASEFRYRDPVIENGDIVIGISQSGETADTIAALSLAKARGAITIGICNTVNSQISKITESGIYTIKYGKQELFYFLCKVLE